MRRSPRRIIPLLFLLALACSTLAPAPTAALAPTPIPSSTPAPTPIILTDTPEPTGAPTDLYLTPGDIIVHPDGPIYSGDLVSFEVLAPDARAPFDAVIYLDDDGQRTQIAHAPLEAYGLGGRMQATFVWVWNTAGLEGPQTITAALDPRHMIRSGGGFSNNSLSITLNVLPRAAMPEAERGSGWLRAESACCVFNYISGTAAARDIEAIKETADSAVSYVEQKLGVEHSSKIVVNLINRLLGHGGFASDFITVSYLDRDYAGGDLQSVFRHEAAHLMARQLGDQRPSLIEEGMATYIAGGHFKPEPFEPRAVGLLALGRAIPLAELADDFYAAQHEIGYLEGAAFAEYLAQTYGWDHFANLLGVFQPASSQSAMLDAGLRLEYGKSLSQLEAEWLGDLRARPADAQWTADIDGSIRFYDAVRRYQQSYDPSAYFLTAWIPDIRRAVHDGITADYSRHPSGRANIALETLLIAADKALDAKDYSKAEQYLRAVNAVLDAGGDFAADPTGLAADYLALTEAALAAGYDPQRISLEADRAIIVASRPAMPSVLTEINWSRWNGAWRMN